MSRILSLWPEFLIFANKSNPMPAPYILRENNWKSVQITTL